MLPNALRYSRLTGLLMCPYNRIYTHAIQPEHCYVRGARAPASPGSLGTWFDAPIVIEENGYGLLQR